PSVRDRSRRQSSASSVSRPMPSKSSAKKPYRTFLSGGLARPTKSPAPLPSWRRATRHSSPAQSSRWMAAWRRCDMQARNSKLKLLQLDHQSHSEERHDHAEGLFVARGQINLIVGEKRVAV